MPKLCLSRATFARHASRYKSSSEDLTMQAIATNYKGLSLLVNLNWDRLLYIGTIAGALLLGAYVGSL